MPLKCKIRKFIVTAFHCEESTHQKQKQPRDLSDAGQKSRELTTPPELPNKEVMESIMQDVSDLDSDFHGSDEDIIKTGSEFVAG